MAFTTRGLELPYAGLAKQERVLRMIQKQLTVREKLPRRGPRRAARMDAAYTLGDGNLCVPTVMALAFKNIGLINVGRAHV